MRTKFQSISSLLVVILLAVFALLSFSGCSDSSLEDQFSTLETSVITSETSDKSFSDANTDDASELHQISAADIDEAAEYSDTNSVALYISLYGHLPSNYISKTKARKAGWVSKEGNLWDVAYGKSIGGARFYDDDHALPSAKGRRWTECDVNYYGGYRGPERIVFSNDGLVYYTPDHYKTFERLI